MLYKLKSFACSELDCWIPSTAVSIVAFHVSVANTITQLDNRSVSHIIPMVYFAFSGQPEWQGTSYRTRNSCGVSCGKLTCVKPTRLLIPLLN